MQEKLVSLCYIDVIEDKSYADGQHPLEIIKKYGGQATVTDLCILLGCQYLESPKIKPENNDDILKYRRGIYWTNNFDIYKQNVYVIDNNGKLTKAPITADYCSIRPVVKSDDIYYNALFKAGLYSDEVEYGEYPQYAADLAIQKILNDKYSQNKLNKTEKRYTLNLINYYEYPEQKNSQLSCEEYEYQGEKYIKLQAQFGNYYDYYTKKGILSNGVLYKNGDDVWIKVEPVIWLINSKNHYLISKKCLVSGIRFNNNARYARVEFEDTELYRYLNEYMFPELSLKEPLNINQKSKKNKKTKTLKLSLKDPKKTK